MKDEVFQLVGLVKDDILHVVGLRKVTHFMQW